MATTTHELTYEYNAEFSQAIEKVIVGGDLSALTPAQRLSYYKQVCESVGLNPLTQPFQYLKLNGRTVLYATKACTDQLRQIHNVSVISEQETTTKDVYVVTVRVRNAEGREDMAKGAVTLGSLSGDALANALMKAETKAKRRATLSICGLSILDETEVETIADARQESSVDPELQAWAEKIANTTNEAELRKEFGEAYKWAKAVKNKQAEEFLIGIKDERKAQLNGVVDSQDYAVSEKGLESLAQIKAKHQNPQTPLTEENLDAEPTSESQSVAEPTQAAPSVVQQAQKAQQKVEGKRQALKMHGKHPFAPDSASEKDTEDEPF